MEIVKGKVPRAPRILLHGTEGVGKTTWASRWPAPLIADLEGGSYQIDVARWTPSTLQELLEGLEQVPAEYRTLVIDTLDAVEKAVCDQVCKDTRSRCIDEACGGYGKGRGRVESSLTALRDSLEVLNSKGKTIILLCHTKVESHDDPDIGQYDRWSPKLDKRIYALFSEWADVIGFAHPKMIKAEDGKVLTTGGRVLTVHSRSSGVVAKNRYSLDEVYNLSDVDGFLNAIRASYSRKDKAND